MSAEAATNRRDRRTRRREGRRLGQRDSGHQARPVEVLRPPSPEEWDAVEVARRWSSALVEHDLDTAMSWYGAEAVLHWEGSLLADPGQIRRAWEAAAEVRANPTSIEPVDAVTLGDGGDGFDVLVRWVGAGTDDTDIESRLRVRQGCVVEQWHGRVVRLVPVQGPSLAVSVGGEVTLEEREAVVAALWHMIESVEPTVRHVSLRIRRHADPARTHPVTLRVLVDRNHHHVVARGSGATVSEAVARLDQRLRQQLEQQASRVRAVRRRGTSSPEGQWRHGDRPQRQAPVARLPEDERLVMVRSTWAGGTEHVDEAIEDLEALDLEVLLFEEQATGAAAVVWRTEHGYRLRCMRGGDPSARWNPPPVADVSVDEQPFPHLDLDSARTELALGEPWVVFCDVDTGQPGLLYRRIDGHDGLVVLGGA